jgi:hypothetical protein
MEDITFFAKDKQGNLRCLPWDATVDLIAAAEGATMKLDNQKNGWKGVCVYQEANGDPLNCPVRALGRRYLHLRKNGATKKTIISAYFNKGKGRRYDATSGHVSSALKLAAGALEYPTIKGIPMERVNTHSLRSGGANALALAGYSDTQIQNMGRWRVAQSHVQRICKERTRMFLIRHVSGHEEKIRIHLVTSLMHVLMGTTRPPHL